MQPQNTKAQKPSTSSPAKTPLGRWTTASTAARSKAAAAMWGAIEMRRLCAAMLAAFACSSIAWAQTTDLRVNTQKGCAFLQRVDLSIVRQIVNGNWSGSCAQGLISGAGVLSFEVRRTDGRSFSQTRMMLASEGKDSGVTLRLSTFSPYLWIKYPHPQGTEGIETHISADRSTEIAGAAFIDKTVWEAFSAAAAKGTPTLSEPQIRAAISHYQSTGTFNREAVIALLQSTNQPNSQVANSSNSADDPKVRGRSARGG